MVRVNIASHGGASFMTAEIDETTTVKKLKEMIYKNKGVSPSRQQLIIEANHEATLLDEDSAKLMSTYSITNDSFKILFKDKGPQISPQIVNIFEYSGALLIYLLFLPLSIQPNLSINKGRSWELMACQQIAAFLWVSHYLKRLIESLCVHNHGSHTVPTFSLLKECVYYWGFAALIGWSVNRPLAEEPSRWRVMVGFPMFCMAMFCNMICHVQLKYLRPKGTNKVGLPRGFLFEYVDCPNYFCEIMMWVAFNVVTGFTVAGVTFCVFGAVYMTMAAKARHAQYKKIYRNKYPRFRKIIFPFIY